MPKKTKREKILAEQHRKAHESVIPSPSPSPAAAALPIDKPTTPVYAFQAASGSTQPVSREAVLEYRAIKIDLIKTLLLAAAAISIELLLYLKMGR